eukprot:4710527-Prymnesium_polylepis.1
MSWLRPPHVARAFLWMRFHLHTTARGLSNPCGCRCRPWHVAAPRGRAALFRRARAHPESTHRARDGQHPRSTAGLRSLRPGRGDR